VAGRCRKLAPVPMEDLVGECEHVWYPVFVPVSPAIGMLGAMVVGQNPPKTAQCATIRQRSFSSRRKKVSAVAKPAQGWKRGFARVIHLARRGA